MENMKIKKILPKKIIILLNKIRQRKTIHHYRSYSQEGEDMILRRIFEREKNGFYIDIGAYHPKKFSNTYFFYLKGWRGINIDAMPYSMNLFKKQRPKDINLEIAISNNKQILTYHIFEEFAFNTFSKKNAQETLNNNKSNLINCKKIQTYALKEILNKHLTNDIDISFMSIDAEGFDYQILESNDWIKYRPKIILVEDLNKSLEKTFNSKTTLLMKKYGYQLYAKTCNTVIYKNVNG